MRLAPREQIVSVSYLTVQPENSLMAEAARGIPVNHSLAEEIIPMRPDLVLAGLYSSADVVRILRQLGLRVEVLGIPSSLAGIRRQVLELGELIGRQDAARALVDEFDVRMQRLAARPRSGLRVLILQPGGFTLGSGTLQDDILRTAGFVNLAAEAGMQGAGYLDLETALNMNPDVLVLDDYEGTQSSLAQALLRHPAWRALSAHVRLVRVSPRHWQCGTPAALDAIDLIEGR